MMLVYKSKALPLATLLIGSALLAGCAAVPKLGARPEMRAAGSFAAGESFASAQSDAAWPAANWWQGYGDAQLSGLIEEGLRDSPDLAAAVARLRAAQGFAQQAGAALLPSIGAEATAGANKQSYNNGIPPAFVPKGWNDTGRVAGTFGFDIDLWGKNRAALAAATSEEEASRIDVEQARLLLSTNIAAAYAQLGQLAATRAVQQQALEVRTQTQRLVSDRVTNGLDTRAELKQADAAVPAARADLIATDETIDLTRNLIAALLGKGPDRGRTIALPAHLADAQRLPGDVTADLIGRRPDIAAARARVEAAASRIKVARADFFPAVNLSALVGLQSLGLDNLFKGTSTYGQVGPAVSLPIFRGGALSGQYRGARANYDAAVAAYDGTVTTAFREVADAVTSRDALGGRLAESRRALTDSEAAYAVAKQRYEGGLSTYLNVLTAEDSLLQARRAVADLEARAFALDVQLVRALGGGFILHNKSARADLSESASHG